MKRSSSFLLASVPLLCLLSVLSAVTVQSFSKSHHIVTFGGAAWGPVVSEKEVELKRAIVADVGTQLLRKYAFLTIINVSSLSVGGHFEARLTVMQALRSNSSSSRLLHIWPPDEVNSMIAQGVFNKTLALHTPSEAANLISVQLNEKGVMKNGEQVFHREMTLIALVTGSCMLLVLIPVLVWMCCQCCSGKHAGRSHQPFPHPTPDAIND
ncbi:hypothetical protein TraAM80_03565 [Trypanosoma rangeli]|uniref:Uncharacterized protein n=1 Tax=Trypanosoma rangeli TaxID=5698 RepID=A0A3R7KG53_TRYRA|nr:uncharacterized protein TraAM80_03565 [Trypanosoma rangeli]RNF07078.1 hypothetical protein TraAM80_03565 [Trypanosoma rangeli]|eukprot:RNF07078.1 hypothetical protein TraAM80_03565 [Trypanosoma rangeli]